MNPSAPEPNGPPSEGDGGGSFPRTARGRKVSLQRGRPRLLDGPPQTNGDRGDRSAGANTFSGRGRGGGQAAACGGPAIRSH